MGYTLPQALQYMARDARTQVRLLPRAVQALHTRRLQPRKGGRRHGQRLRRTGYSLKDIFGAGQQLPRADRQLCELHDAAEGKRLPFGTLPSAEPIREYRGVPHILRCNARAVLFRLHSGGQEAVDEETYGGPEGACRQPGETDSGHTRLALQRRRVRIYGKKRTGHPAERCQRPRFRLRDRPRNRPAREICPNQRTPRLHTDRASQGRPHRNIHRPGHTP